MVPIPVVSRIVVPAPATWPDAADRMPFAHDQRRAREETAMHPHMWFDWIFFAIVGIPWVLGFVELIKPSN